MSGWARIFMNRLLRLILITVLVIVIAAGFAWLVYQHQYAGKIFEGITIGGIPVGGLTPQEAALLLQKRLGPDALPHLSLNAGDRTWLVSASDLGAAYLPEPAIANALKIGRSGIFRQDLVEQIRALLYGYTVQPSIRFETSRLAVFIRELASEMVQPSRNAQFTVEGLDISTIEGKTGQEINYTATQQAIQDAILNSLPKAGWGDKLRLHIFPELYAQAQANAEQVISISLVTRDIAPRASDYQQANAQAQILLSGPITLEATMEQINLSGASEMVTRVWVVDQALLASWLEVKNEITPEGQAAHVELNQDKILAYLQSLNNQISRPPMEGSYVFDPATQSFTVNKPAQVGYSLDVQAASKMVQELCFSSERSGELPLRSVQPTVRLADLQAMLPLTLISTGESWFGDSTAERYLNVRRAAEEFQSVVVPPKSTFSFLAQLGAVTIANGYSESWIIYGNKSVLGPGGGVCQVATTLFRAAFFGGFPIVERYPHSYRISRYEPPVGLDAAVFSPSTDLKFVNDMDTPIIITNAIDEAKGIITFYIYGAPTNRTVHIEDASISNPKPAGEAIYEEDPSLAPGEIVMIDQAHDGIDAVLTRVIEQDGKVIAREQFFSRYLPWPARYLVGPSQ